jgi:uncharacterized protein (DUF1501 family)
MAITRRKFIRNSAITAIGLGLSSPLLERTGFASGRAGRAAATGNDKVVVTLNLFGGNDGLNTVIPVSQYGRYRDLRPDLGIPEDQLLALNGTTDFAFNPGMTALRDLYNRGKVAVVLGVGAPEEAPSLFDHEGSQYEFQSADVTNEHYYDKPTGWLGRYLDTIGEGVVTPGIDFGGGRLILSGDPDLVISGARREALTISSIEQFQLQPAVDTEARMAAYETLMAIPNAESAVAERNRQLRIQAIAQSAIVRERTASYTPLVTYPDFQNNYLSYSLFQCAQLIAADLGVKALSVGTDGYDTHSNQNDGNYHNDLLLGVSDAVVAFHDDLTAHGLGQKVVLVVFSEFGRRPEQNNDVGTDHGYGSVAFVVGEGVHGGLYGEHPSLEESALVLDGNVDVTTDFRSVYATILDKHLGGDPAEVLGEAFSSLGFLG